MFSLNSSTWASQIWTLRVILHLTAVCHQGLNKLRIVLDLVIPQESMNHCNKAVPCWSLRPYKIFWRKPFHSMTLFICGPIKTPALTFAADWLRKVSWRWLKVGDSSPRALTNYFTRPSFNWSGRNSIFFLGSSNSFHLILFFLTLNSACCGQSCLMYYDTVSLVFQRQI